MNRLIAHALGLWMLFALGVVSLLLHAEVSAIANPNTAAWIARLFCLFWVIPVLAFYLGMIDEAKTWDKDDR